MNKKVCKEIAETIYKNRKPNIVLENGTKIYFG